MSDQYKATVEQVPLVLLRSNGQSFVIGTPEGIEENKGHRGAVFGYVRLFFPSLDYDSLRLEALLPGRCWAIVVESSWLPFVRHLGEGTDLPPVFLVKDKDSPPEPAFSSCVESTAEETEDLLSDDGTVCSLKGGAPRRSAGEAMTLYIKTLTGKTIILAALPDDKIDYLMVGIQLREDIPPVDQRLIYDGRQLEVGKQCWEYGIKNESTLHLVIRLHGDKPVIYLLPPLPLPEVQVSLTLSPSWSFSARYPVTEILKEKSGDSTVFWRVSADSSGKLVDLQSKEKTKLSYLFWEAHSTGVPSSPPPSLGNGTPSFDPSSPSLNASNGAALPLPTFLPYLDKVLSSLALHTSARNDFVTFWLPSLSRMASCGQHIAFRFLPQTEYEPSARLAVEPKPDVITRVFLLFKGVNESDVNEWKKADEVDWVKEVGVEEEKVRDEGLFRVLEWGGMEVVG
ncbi:hypothetical protein JCM8547_006070 [Rhodosporidiobolus lusitaniae]